MSNKSSFPSLLDQVLASLGNPASTVSQDPQLSVKNSSESYVPVDYGDPTPFPDIWSTVLEAQIQQTAMIDPVSCKRTADLLGKYARGEVSLGIHHGRVVKNVLERS